MRSVQLLRARYGRLFAGGVQNVRTYRPTGSKTDLLVSIKERAGFTNLKGTTDNKEEQRQSDRTDNFRPERDDLQLRENVQPIADDRPTISFIEDAWDKGHECGVEPRTFVG